MSVKLSNIKKYPKNKRVCERGECHGKSRGKDMHGI